MSISTSFLSYFNAIKQYDPAESTEHTLRSALENLLNDIAREGNLNITIIHEPKRDKNKLGAPDYKIKFNESTVGYLETKAIGENLDEVLKSDQIAKYKRLSENIVVTDYLEWIWLRSDQIIKRETFCYSSDVGHRKASLDSDKSIKVADLITKFLSTPPERIADAKKLSKALAVRCHDLREFLLEVLDYQSRNNQSGKLHGLYAVFKQDVFQDLGLKEFADAFAQTLGYGLFLAKLNSGEQTQITLQNAKNFIPTNFALIRELVEFLDELERDEYRGIKWLVEEILSIMNTLNLDAIQEDLTFTKRQRKFFGIDEEERPLFDKDPYVYFYEDFLNAYDKDTRKGRGVYYTPPPVVSFIVRAINDILKDSFDITSGLADRKRVTVLDFATGTGTFLLEILHQIFETVSESIRNHIVKEHVLKNLYGFEYLIAPYTVAHLKLSQFLLDNGYTMGPAERLNIFLTNTLEPIDPQGNLLLPALSREVKAAQEVKDKPILVITGNPPYSGHSKNTGEWITELIKTYKVVDGQPLDEKNSKWLQDDYVKFIRFAQWKLDQVAEGVVGIITNHSFLDSPTFRGMRQSLMQTFNQIYILDLHGSSIKKERTTEGGNDENVFDIRPGVAISLMVKKKGLSKVVSHADLWGERKEKYRTLAEAKKDTIEWKKLKPSKPFYMFIPQNEKLREEYEQGWKITDIFSVNVLGFQTHRDHFAIAYEKADIENRLKDLLDKSISDHDLEKKYHIHDNRDWQITKARTTLNLANHPKQNIVACAYRPFDARWCFFGYGFMDFPRRVFLDNCHLRNNLILGIGRAGSAIPERPWELVTIARTPIDANIFRRGGVNASPLYCYPPPIEENNAGTLLEEAGIEFREKEMYENFSPSFRQFVDVRYEHHFSPEEILGYVYAVLHSPSFRTKYKSFLKNDYPRIPFVRNCKTFKKLSTLGWELAQAHVFDSIPQNLAVDVIPGEFGVETTSYDAQCELLYFNKKQYFFPVPQDVWEFHIGGYKVLNKFFKSRKGRILSLDEIENVQNLVNILRFTIDQMHLIDKCWNP